MSKEYKRTNCGVCTGVLIEYEDGHEEHFNAGDWLPLTPEEREHFLRCAERARSYDLSVFDNNTFYMMQDGFPNLVIGKRLAIQLESLAYDGLDVSGVA
jgi:hypothetical protein